MKGSGSRSDHRRILGALWGSEASAESVQGSFLGFVGISGLCWVFGGFFLAAGFYRAWRAEGRRPRFPAEVPWLRGNPCIKRRTTSLLVPCWDHIKDDHF